MLLACMVHISCIMCPCDLPDMYTHALRPDGPWAEVYISGKSLGPMMGHNFRRFIVPYSSVNFSSSKINDYHDY